MCMCLRTGCVPFLVFPVVGLFFFFVYFVFATGIRCIVKYLMGQVYLKQTTQKAKHLEKFVVDEIVCDVVDMRFVVVFNS